MACLNWSDLKHVLTAASYVVILDFDVGVGSKEARNPCLSGQHMTLVPNGNS